MSREYICHNWDTYGYPGEYVYGDYGYLDDYYMDELWKPIYDVPGYWVSNKARVWSSYSNAFIMGTPLRSGHVDISLRLDGRRIHRYLHRLVAEAFIPNPHNYPEVRHLDDNPANNEVWNLAWGTQYDNVQDSIRNGHFRYFTRADIEHANEIRRTPVVAINLRTGKRLFFVSQQEAARNLGMSQSSINDVIYGRARSCNGYCFAFQNEIDDTFDHTKYSYRQNKMPVQATNIDTRESYIYESARDASRHLGISEASVSNVLTGKSRYTKGWIFKYLNTGDEYND